MQSFINALNKDTRALATEHDAACAEADALRSWLDDGAVGAAADLEAEVNATAGAVADRDRLQRTLNSSESEAASLRQQLQDAVDQHYVDAVSIPPPSSHTHTHTHILPGAYSHQSYHWCSKYLGVQYIVEEIKQLQNNDESALLYSSDVFADV